MKFKYTALGADHRKLVGIIEGNNEVQARDNLHKMGLSILFLEEVDDIQAKQIEENSTTTCHVSQKSPQKEEKKANAVENTQDSPPKKQVVKNTLNLQNDSEKKAFEKAKTDILSEKESNTTQNAEAQESQHNEKDSRIQSFEFQAKDPSGKDINGTIDGLSKLSVLRRLKEEYSFDVEYLYPVNATQEQKDIALKNGVTELEKKLQYIIQKEQEASKPKGLLGFFQNNSETQSELDQEKLEEARLEEESKKLQIVVNNLLELSRKVIDTFRKDLPGDFVQKVTTHIDRLSALKFSNNFPLINKLSADLVNMLEPNDSTHPLYKKNFKLDTFVEEVVEEPDNKQEFIDDLKREKEYKEKTLKNIDELTSRLSKIVQPEEKKPKVSKPSIFDGLSKKLSTQTSTIPEIQQLKEQKTHIRKQLFTALKKYLFSKKIQKRHYKTSLQNLWHEYLHVSHNLHNEKYKYTKDYSSTIKDIRLFIGALLTFYVGYFLIAHTFTSKNTGVNIDFFWKTLSTPTILFIIITLFIFYALIHIKLLYFRKNTLAGVLLFLVGFCSSSFIIINFS